MLFLEGCGCCDDYGGDVKMMFDSLQFLKTKILPTTTIYPAHIYGANTSLTFDQVMQNNMVVSQTFKNLQIFKKTFILNAIMLPKHKTVQK